MLETIDSLWYTYSADPTSLGLAAISGRLEKVLRQRGIKLQALLESNDYEIRESYFDHHLLNSVRHGSNLPAIWARSEGQATRLLGASWVDEVQVLVTTPESGIKTVRDLRNRRFGLSKSPSMPVDIGRARALRGLENALLLEGLSVADVELVDYPYGGTFSEEPVHYSFGGKVRLRNPLKRRCNYELLGLLRGDIDAIYLKGAYGLHLVDEFGLKVIIDVGSHPDPLIRSNVGTPRTLTVDQHLLDNHPDIITLILETVMYTERWARLHPDETIRLLAVLVNSSEYWVTAAYGEDVNQRFQTNLDERSVKSLQDMSHFLERWGFISKSVDVAEWIDPKPIAGLFEKINTACG